MSTAAPQGANLLQALRNAWDEAISQATKGDISRTAAALDESDRYLNQWLQKRPQKQALELLQAEARQVADRIGQLMAEINAEMLTIQDQRQKLQVAQRSADRITPQPRQLDFKG